MVGGQSRQIMETLPANRRDRPENPGKPRSVADLAPLTINCESAQPHTPAETDLNP